MNSKIFARSGGIFRCLGALLLGTGMFVSCLSAAEPTDNSWAMAAPDPALPNVLILGDSISIGYTRQVRHLLAGEANVFRPMNADGTKPENCQGTTYSLQHIDRWLGEREWDLIHFNWGLHDLKRVKEAGSSRNSTDPRDPYQATAEQYGKNLEILVGKLKATGARLIFATTTPVVPDSAGPLREPQDSAKYNTAARRIISGDTAELNDLYSFSLPRLGEIQHPRNVHFTPKGSALLAEQVATKIRGALPDRLSQSAGELRAARAQVLALGELTDAPIIRDEHGAPITLSPGDKRAIYFDALEYEGRSTRAYALVSIPEGASPENPVPGIVLVHGGGGSAFQDWVDLWAERGYAAISIAVEGQTDQREPQQEGRGPWVRHPWAGPSRVGIYGDLAKPLTDQWMYHAVADTVLANSLLREVPGVDADRVGVMGISWGGVITSTVIGIDDRFAFAIPTYGCGHKFDSANQYGAALGGSDLYQKVWDPMVRLHRATMPVQWLSWPGDKHFPMEALSASYRAAPGPRLVTLIPEMGHSHGAGWRPTDSYAFADSIVRDGTPWAGQLSRSLEGDQYTVKFRSTTPLHDAVLISTEDVGFTGHRNWVQTPAKLVRQGDEWVATATVPLNSTAWFINARSGELIVSSDYEQAPAPSTWMQRNWVVLDPAVVRKSTTGLTWDFSIRNPGSYSVQVLSPHPLPAADLTATVTIDETEMSDTLRESYVVSRFGPVLNVAEFKSPHNFATDGPHTLSLQTDAPVEQVRLVPSTHNFVGSGIYDEQWRAMHQSPEKQAALAWFKQARYGMFIHWGIYSQAGGSWKGTHIEKSPYPGPGVAEWLMFKFRIPRDEYAELAKTFNPDKSFAQTIARLAKDAGMQYLVITTKHHDGFALFDSASSDYDMVDATPYGADAIKELYDACQEEGIEFGVYYSHGNDWQQGTDGNYATMKAHHDSYGVTTRPQGKNLWDPSPNTYAEYLANKAYPQVAELVDLLPKLRLLWFDGEGLITEAQAFRFYQMIYDRNPNIIVNRRVGYSFGDYLDAGDNVIPSVDAALNKHWETCGTTNNSWGYKAHDDDWKSPRELLYYFIDITSKGGNYLLNIGPDGEGHVPAQSAANLRTMGTWVKRHADAIFGTERWTTVHEGGDEALLKGTGHRAARGFARQFSSEDYWFTAKQNKVYAMSLVAVEDTVRIRSLGQAAGRITGVRLLGEEQVVTWRQTEDALELDSREWPKHDLGFAVEVTFK